jgi:uncharacterized protein (TIGR00369 family)
VKLPPYAALIGAAFDPDAAEPVLLMPFTDAVLGRPGFIHGGALAGLLELAAIAALTRSMDGEGRLKPVNVTIDYMRGGRDKPTRALGHVDRLGTRVANVTSTAWQDDPDRPIAAARMTFLLDRD